MNDLMADMPKSLQAIMGVGSFDLSKASGYYGMLFMYLVLMATIHAAMLGATIIAKEERDKTSEFLFVKPVSRGKIIMAKLLAALTNIVIFNIVTFASSVIIVGKVSDGEKVNGEIAVTMMGMFLLQVLFMVIGSAISAVKKRPKTAASLATAILLLTFVLSIVIDLNENLDLLKYLTPFKYFEAKHMMVGDGLETVSVILSLIITVALTYGTYHFYKKKDLNG
jgi:ABC-2 type transport system permease protein